MTRALLTAALFAAGLHAQGGCEASNDLPAARQALDQSDPDRAESLLAPLQETAAHCPEVVLLLGRARMAQGMPVLARGLLERYTQLVPRDAAGYRTLAELLLRQRDYPAAEFALRRALEIQPASVSSLLLSSQLWSAQGRDAEAQQALTRACRLEPNNAAAHFQLGSFFDARNRPADAVAAFRQAVSLDPANPSAWDYLALNLELAAQPEQAERAYKKGLAVNREPRVDAFLGYNYGRFLMKCNRLEESKTYLDRAVQLTPKVRAVHYELAKVYVLMERHAEARAEAEAALNAPDPGQYILDLQVYVLLTRIYRQLGEEELASKFATLAREARVPPPKEGRR